MMGASRDRLTWLATASLTGEDGEDGVDEGVHELHQPHAVRPQHHLRRPHPLPRAPPARAGSLPGVFHQIT